jgi:formate hydrogenlyase transcriptional activator
VDNLCRRMSKPAGTISPETMAKLQAHPWPGNVRQLQNTLERAIILAQGANLDVTLPEPPAGDHVGVAESAATDVLEQVERAHILRVLHQTNWVIAGPHGAAVRLGLKRTTLHYRMVKLGIARGGKAAISPSP